MSSTLSFNNFWAMANLTAPASGVTHAAKWAIGILSGKPVTLNMLSQMEFLGDFVGQAMMVDNTANATDLTITELSYGWTRVVQAGTLRVFQYPAVDNQVFIFSTTGNASVIVSVFDWPAFPDESFLTANVTGQDVTIVGPLPLPVEDTVAEGYLASIAGQGTAVAGAATSVATGGTPVTVFTNLHKGGAYITNPNAATESLFVDEVNPAGTTAPGTHGTTIELVAGQTQVFPANVGSVTANAVTSGHAFTAVSRG